MSARNLLLKTGLEEFLAHGYDGTGIAQILERTGLSKGAFYHHFGSKLALFEEIVARHFPSPLDTLDWDAHAGLGADGQKRAIAALYRSLDETGETKPGDLTRYYALFFDALSRLPDYRVAMQTSYARMIDLLAYALQAEQELSSAAAQMEARNFIARFEGELYLMAVVGMTPVPERKN